MKDIKKSKSKSSQKKTQKLVNNKNIVLKLNIKVPITDNKLRNWIGVSIMGLCSLAMTSCNNIDQPSLTHKTEQTNINITTTNVEKLGVNIK